MITDNPINITIVIARYSNRQQYFMDILIVIVLYVIDLIGQWIDYNHQDNHNHHHHRILLAPRHDALQLLHLSSTYLVMDGLGRGSVTTGTGTGNTVGWASEIRSSAENDGSSHYFQGFNYPFGGGGFLNHPQFKRHMLKIKAVRSYNG